MAKTKSISSLAKALTSSDQRQNIRFEPDPSTIAWVDVGGGGKKKSFEPSVPALVSEESHRGCGLVTKMTKYLQVGSLCRVKLGPAAPLVGEVRWRVELDSQTIRVGIMYLE